MQRPTGLVVLVSAGALGLIACGGAGEEGAVMRTTTQAADPREVEGQSACRAVEAPAPKGVQDLEAPTLELDDETTYTAIMETNCGTIEIRLASDKAPKTVASFVSLARKDFFDDLTFHRIGHDAAGGDFVIQGGDPEGSGQGGPGYSIVEPPPENVVYDRGTVAMAKTEIEKPGTSGSQFFIVTAKDARLPRDYALLGQVVEGEETVRAIADVDFDPTSEMPLSPVVIEGVTIVEGDGPPR